MPRKAKAPTRGKRGRPPGSKNKPKPPPPPPTPEEILEDTERVLEEAIDITLPSSINQVRDMIRTSPYGVKPETCDRLAKSAALRAHGYDWQEIADALGVTREAARRAWCDHPEEVARQNAILAKRVLEKSQSSLMLVRSALNEAAFDAVATLRELMMDKNVSAPTRRNAATDTLNLAFAGNTPDMGGKNRVKQSTINNFISISERQKKFDEEYIDVTGTAEVVSSETDEGDSS